MKVGDYVRTKYGIAKYISDKITKYAMYYVVDKDIMTCNVEGWENCISGSNEIIKSSPNIIDLIEVGDVLIIKDFVDEGCMVFTDIYFIQNETQLLNIKSDLEKNKNKKLYSIVTKEQFSSMEYKLNNMDKE